MMNDKCLADYKYYFSERFNLLSGNSLKVLPYIADNSIDSIVTDPPYELGFMGKSWDNTGVANDVELWKEVLRVLKPGGYLLSFGGSRTYHRMAVAIEDAGFEIRDQIMWVYGSGFPKSHNISKGIDKQEGFWRGKAGKVTTANSAMSGPNYERTPMDPPVTDFAKQWQGWGTALKPAHEPIVLARKPFAGTVANNVLTYGTGGLNIDGNRVGNEMISTHNAPKGTFAGGEPDRGSDTSTYENHTGRWPANFIHDGSDEVVELFPITNPAKSGFRNPNGKQSTNAFGDYNGQPGVVGGHSDNGGSAARFFYCAKASKRDRNEGLNGFEAKFAPTMNDGIGAKEHNEETATKKLNHHPTVKPTDLMQYLCRLITPPGGTILDPFLGSGSTGKAAIYEGFKFIGIESTEEYLPIAKARIEYALNNLDEKLF